jgi:uncharacterized protein YerC
MIQTNKQATIAVNEIVSSTGWSYRRIGDESRIHFATISRIARNLTTASRKDTMVKLYNLQMRVRGQYES